MSTSPQPRDSNSFGFYTQAYHIMAAHFDGIYNGWFQLIVLYHTHLEFL